MILRAGQWSASGQPSLRTGTAPTYTEAHVVPRFQASLSAFSTVWSYPTLMALLFWSLFYAL
jgi:hypothetical protein